MLSSLFFTLFALHAFAAEPISRSCEFYNEVYKEYACEPRNKFLELINLGNMCGDFHHFGESLDKRMQTREARIRTLAGELSAIYPPALKTISDRVVQVGLEPETSALLAELTLNDLSRPTLWPHRRSQTRSLTKQLSKELTQYNQIARAHRWVWDTMYCLQTDLLATLMRQPGPRDQLNCNRIYDESVIGHMACYRSTGFCEIGPFWSEILFKVIGVRTIAAHPLEAARIPQTCNSALEFLRALFGFSNTSPGAGPNLSLQSRAPIDRAK